MKPIILDLRWILPSSLGLGLVLSLLGPGTWWLGWLAYFILLTLGLLALAALWRSTGASRTLGLMLLFALIFRLGLGVAFSYILPPYGNDTEVQNAGYIFRDAYNRDSQAWELASSGESLWKAFDKSYSADQYGGLLLVSSLLYRCLSPDVHRPWLIVLMGSLTAAIGIALAWKAARKAWGESVALGVGWIMALYPEAVLLGSSQMREPFLITFVSMALWGVLGWKENRLVSLAWLGGAILGLLLFSPGVAVVAIFILLLWGWLVSGRSRFSWRAFLVVLGVLAVGVVLFWAATGHGANGAASPLQALVDWLRFSVNYDVYTVEQTSDWLWRVFRDLPSFLRLPFIAVYGIAQPVLPAAIADPAVWPMRFLGILRALGWYSLVPFLLYSLRPICKMNQKRERLAWLWLWLASWFWIILASVRAGGDQWDNPRYRAILLLFQAALAVQALIWQRSTRDRWLVRLLAVEGVFLVFFGYWYAARYTEWRAGQVHIFVIIAAIVVVSALIFIVGWVRDWQRNRSRDSAKRT